MRRPRRLLAFVLALYQEAGMAAYDQFSPGSRGEACLRPGNDLHGELRGLGADALAQRLRATEQPKARLHFHADGFVDDGDARRPLERPRRQSPKLVVMRGCGARRLVEEQRCLDRARGWR